MRKLSIALLSVLVVTLFAVPAFAQIAGSLHDFTTSEASTTYTNLSTETVNRGGACAACHVPHNGANASTILFGSYYNDGETLTGYGNTLAGNTAGADNPVTLMCMSCHDGTIAINSTTSDSMASIGANLGTDLSNDHPVDISYTQGTAGLVAKSTAKGYGIDLYNGDTEITCGSCHDPHKQTTTGGKQFIQSVTNPSGDLCLACHGNK